jgi:hypothetical protein
MTENACCTNRPRCVRRSGRRTGHLDLVSQGAKCLSKLINENAICARTVVVQALLLFAVPPDRHITRFANRYVQRSDGLIAIIRSSNTGGDITRGNGWRHMNRDNLALRGALEIADITLNSRNKTD